MFDSSWITRSLNENETIESVLCGHSELLVIALNLIQEPVPKFIQVVKNLRVCGHCRKWIFYFFSSISRQQFFYCFYLR